MKKVINAQANTVTFTFDGLEPVVFNAGNVSTNMHQYAALHGFSARIGDNAARSRKQPDGSIVNVTEAMRRADVEELVKHYESGTEQWELRTARVAPQNATILAIASKLGLTYAEAEAEVSRRMLAEMVSDVTI